MLGPDFDALLDAAQQGDESAFARLWRDIQPSLLRYLQVIGAEPAADVASEVWLDVVRRLPTFAGDEAAFRGWLFAMARRRAIDGWRRASRAPTWLVAQPELYERPGPDLTVEAVDERLGTIRALRLIAGLPKDQAEVIALRVIVGLDVAAVATLVGKSRGAVRVNAHRGLRRLAVLLERQAIKGGVTR